MRLIDADTLGNRMYHESFEKDSDLQKWDSGCWIRYKLFEQVLRAAPTIDPTHITPPNTLGALDCVERQKAIDESYQVVIDGDVFDVVQVETLMGLPSVQPERKRGKWRRRLVDSGFNADWHCSECGWKTSLEEHGYNFCPNCGCRMEEGDSDE